MGAPTYDQAVAGLTTSANAVAHVTQDVAKLGPLATTYHGATPSVPFQNYVAPKQAGASDVSKFTHFLGGVLSQTGHIAAGAGEWLGKQVLAIPQGIEHLGAGLGHVIPDNMVLNSLNGQSQQNSQRLENTIKAFKAGRMTKDEYKKELFDISQNFDNLVNQQNAVSKNISLSQDEATKGLISTSATLVTILTAGFGKAAATAVSADGLVPMAEKSAADWIASKAAAPVFNGAEKAMSLVAADGKAFAALNKTSQWALQKSMAEVVATGENLTGKQIARATAANLALKYPIYYNMVDSQGDQVYKELDQQKYGDAVRTIAFTALLALSGGPIGQALKYGGKAVKGISARTFGQTTFWDSLSAFYGDKNPAGFRNAVVAATKDMAPAERDEFIKNLSAVEATNVGATGGDAAAAAFRVAKGMTSYEGLDLSTVTHEDALKNMVNAFTVQREVDAAAEAAGLGKTAVGRLDARSKSEIAKQLMTAEDKDARLSLWEQMKQENPNQAWANNDNFDKQIKSLIDAHENPSALATSILNINAATTVKGFPKAMVEKWAKQGYVPIQPRVNEAPFKEGTGEIASRFAGDGDVWTKAITPVPILGEIGGLLTNLGLSPNASTQRVYQLYNEALSKNLINTRFVGDAKIVGESKAQTADTIVKQLSDYMRNPTRGGIQIGGARVRPPLTDLRQLTTKDIQEALGVGRSDAKDVGNALMQSMLDVPLAVRGLGDRAVDFAAKIPGFNRYMQLQGAGRFAWNPFFKAKVSTKIEILAQAEAGGKFPTVAGTNFFLKRIFPDTYHQIDGMRDILRSKGAFDEKPVTGLLKGQGSVAEATDATGDILEQVGANLHQPLTVSQERSVASLVMAQAQKAGQTGVDFVERNPENVRDTIQMITHYDRNANFLNSPLARTLNFAFFPFRFETKVATIMARSLAKSDPMTQLAVIAGLYKAHDFLNSPEGMVWYSQNSTVIKAFEYFTPIQTLGQVADILGGKPDSISSFGELGGLPFGFIPTMLDAAGLTNLTQSAYLDPKTAEEYSHQVPANVRGQALSALQSLIGTLFAYPGSELGLPSKTKLAQGIAFQLGDKKTDLKNAPDLPLSEQQKAYQQAVQGANGQNPTSVPSGQPAPTVSPANVPVTATPINVPKPPKLKSPKAKSGSPGRKKKADFTPYLLPGQTTLGQL